MTNHESLKIYERDTTITLHQLRQAGYVPGTVYGKDVTPFSIQVKAHDFQLALNRGIRHFQLDGMGQTLNVEVKQLQMENTKPNVLHVEFYVPSAGSAKKSKAAQPEAKSAKPEEAPSNAAEAPAEALVH